MSYARHTRYNPARIPLVAILNPVLKTLYEGAIHLKETYKAIYLKIYFSSVVQDMAKKLSTQAQVKYTVNIDTRIRRKKNRVPGPL